MGAGGSQVWCPGYWSHGEPRPHGQTEWQTHTIENITPTSLAGYNDNRIKWDTTGLCQKSQKLWSFEGLKEKTGLDCTSIDMRLEIKLFEV